MSAVRRKSREKTNSQNNYIEVDDRRLILRMNEYSFAT